MLHDDRPMLHVDLPMRSDDLPTLHANLPTRSAHLPMLHASLPTRSAHLPMLHARLPRRSANLPMLYVNLPMRSANLPMVSGSSQVPDVCPFATECSSKPDLWRGRGDRCDQTRSLRAMSPNPPPVGTKTGKAL